ncbi:hypothetical protein J6590_106716, partial [Homalodisca vitripennis]
RRESEYSDESSADEEEERNERRRNVAAFLGKMVICRALKASTERPPVTKELGISLS